MHVPGTVLASIALLIGTAVAQSTKYSSPYVDPFYNAPANLSQYPPGSVLNSRVVQSQMQNVSAQQILYRTSNTNNTPIVTVATILKGPNSNGHQLVAYQDAEDSVNRTCSPSWLFASGQLGQGDIVGPGSYMDALNWGYTLVVPDHEGPASAFMAGRLAGRAVLDAIRAAIQFPGSGLRKNSTIGAMGYSGGGFATAWAAALHATYAPELKIAGFVVGGTPTNVSASFLSVDGTAVSSLGFASFAGLMQEYPTLKTRMNKLLTRNGSYSLSLMRRVCNADYSTNGKLYGQTQLQLLQYQRLLSPIMQTAGAALLSDPEVASVLNSLILGLNVTERPKAPVYMFHGAADQVIPYYDAVKTAQAWCQQGANITFASEVGLGVGHYSTQTQLASKAFAWLSPLMQGGQPPVKCEWNTDFLGIYVSNTQAPDPPLKPLMPGF